MLKMLDNTKYNKLSLIVMIFLRLRSVYLFNAFSKVIKLIALNHSAFNL